MADKLRVKHKQNGLVLEREAADASAMVSSGYYEWAAADDLSLRERVNALQGRPAEFRALAVAVMGEHIHQNEQPSYIVDRIVSHIEAGKIALPEGLPDKRAA